MAYRVIVSSLGGTPLGEVQPKNLQFSWQLNNAGACGFLLSEDDPMCDPNLLIPGQSELKIYKDGTLLWGGYLWTVSASTDEATVRFGGEGWFSRLMRRYVESTKTYSSVDQFDIAWDLINFTQNKTYGALGITRENTNLSGITRTETIAGSDRVLIGEKIIQLASRNQGFDFEITADKVWKVYYPRRGSSLGTTFELGKNIRSLQVEYDSSVVRTELTGRGDGVTVSVQNDTTALGLYGRLEDTVSLKDVLTQTTLDDHTKEELRRVKQTRAIPQIQAYAQDPKVGEYMPGDEARIRAKKGYINIDRSMRITSVNVEVSDEGYEAVGVFWDEPYVQLT